MPVQKVYRTRTIGDLIKVLQEIADEHGLSKEWWGWDTGSMLIDMGPRMVDHAQLNYYIEVMSPAQVEDEDE